MKHKNMESACKNGEEYNHKDNEHTDVENPIYYGVHIPDDFQTNDLNPYVYQNKSDVFQVLKQHKKARFKAFSLFHEAADFSLNGIDNSNISIVDYAAEKKGPAESVQLGEKQSPFKVPKPQDLIVLRKAIEKGDYDRVYNIIWKNPRYLISNGDTPSILQEGSRYNALHIAAKAKSSKIAELLLNTISNVEFVKLLYGDDNEENAKERAKVFADLYLNTPDKALNETPLHFAVKFGAVDVVEVLVSYPQCDKTVINKYGQIPAKIICDRVDGPNKKLRERIEQLLEDTYYVPVLRAEDNSLPPKIGNPFSPVNPPVFNTHPSSPRLEIQAYAGPMNKENAERFRKVWKTPPRSLNFNTPTKSLNHSLDSVASLKYKDPLKGLELVGKTLATQYDITWKEYWPFLDSFVDITSEEGLLLFENYLKERVLDRSASMASMNLEDSVCEETSTQNLSSISELCHAFQAIQLNSSTSSNSFQDELDSKISKYFSPFLGLERACQVFATRFSNNIVNNQDENLINILDTEIKQLEVVILSYMNDNRFSGINFSCVHCRLSHLIAQKLNSKFLIGNIYKKMHSLTEICSQSFDCFSSDDESASSKNSGHVRTGTSTRKQLLCLAHSILNRLNQNLEPYCDNATEEDCVKIWGNLTPCPCVLYPRKARRNSNLQRNNSRKYNSGIASETIRRLFRTSEEDEDILNESFFTPNTSPNWSDEDDDDDDFDDASSWKDYDVYIDGKSPSTYDGAVFNALMYSGCVIEREKYPNIYLWKHNVSQFTEEQRKSWRNKKIMDCFSPSPPSSTSTPVKSLLTSTPTKSWMRITGMNSPKRLKQSTLLNGI